MTERGEYDIDAVIKESFDHAYETAIKNAVEHGGDSLETTPEVRKFSCSYLRLYLEEDMYNPGNCDNVDNCYTR